MVSLSDVQSSNSRVATSLPPGLVAVFVGATSGIGETALKQFAKHARQPRVYFVGRSQEAADRIAAECKTLNSEGEYIFIKAEVSLLHVVDEICNDIKSKEKALNLLFVSQGTMISYTKTTEDLHYAMALSYYSRVRFIVNLLPLLQQATALRRVVTVFAAGKEGAIDTSDYQAWKLSLLSVRGHMSSMNTLSLEAIAKKAPDVSFIHNFPGAVKSGVTRGATGVVISTLKVVFAVIGPLVFMSPIECGERHLFLATSAMYPPSSGGNVASGVPLADGAVVARGTNGKSGSGVYSVGSDGESSGPKVEELLAKLRKEGVPEKLWKHTEEEFERITAPKVS